jgi:hypothetical protein
MPGPTEALKSFDDTHHASKTVSSVVVRCEGFIDCLSLTYRPNGESNKHGGWGGTEHKFQLADGRLAKALKILRYMPNNSINLVVAGEYITEMRVWADQHWVYGLQFATNTGRCSPHYGRHLGGLTIARDQGGALVGFSSRVRKHGQWGDLLGWVQAS